MQHFSGFHFPSFLHYSAIGCTWAWLCLSWKYSTSACLKGSSPITVEGLMSGVPCTSALFAEYDIWQRPHSQKGCFCILALLHPLSFPGGSVVKNPLAIQEIQIWPQGQEDPLEEGVATHSSILAWKITWREESGGLQPIGLKRSWTWLKQLSMCACIPHLLSLSFPH